MFIVIFKRRDNKPDEEYYYHTKEEATRHIDLFINDDSGLYDEIDLVEWKDDLNIISSLKFN